ncbi:MAG: hypothetical protein H6807_15700 [Planctomycetes bacterium]|nr:hypothetical protein [Planctomycetota bacterium]
MSEGSPIHRTKPRFDPHAPPTAFDRIVAPLKLFSKLYLILFAVVVLFAAVVLIDHFLSPDVYELRLVGLPEDTHFVGLLERDEDRLLDHNFPVKRLGGSTDNPRAARDSRASFPAESRAVGLVILPLRSSPETARLVVIRRQDGRVETTDLAGLEGSAGDWKLDLRGRSWTTCAPALADRLALPKR